MKPAEKQAAALKYIERNDTLYIQGTGDPTLLHAYFNDNQTVEFLKKHKNIALLQNNIRDKKYGPGWAWEDYDAYYQPEISALPIYGNVVTIYNDESLNVIPTYFKDSVTNISFHQKRELDQNQFYFSSTRTDTVEVPFKIDSNLARTLLEDVLQQKISLIANMPSRQKEVLYSVLSDTVYKRMMHESDNFIAEQLLILASSTLSDTLNGRVTRDHILENQLLGLSTRRMKLSDFAWTRNKGF
jgi:D-alanyl-D-alanine carboxypeptidase/D-alanyl-D-alanine-endopeptidase (penicillin-binding protein 4)